MSFELPGAVLLSPDSERDLAALCRAMARAGGFALHVVVCDGRARAELTRRLKGWSGDAGVPPLHFFPTGQEASASVDRFLAGGGPAPPLTGAVLLDGDALVADEIPVHALNAARDRLGELVAGPLVLVVSPARGVELARMAPDLFDVRTATYEVKAAPLDAGVLPAPAPERVEGAAAEEPGPSLDPEYLRLRALEASASPPPAGALVDAWLRLAESAQWKGNPRAAALAGEEAARLARSIHYTRGVAEALRYMAGGRKLDGPIEEAETLLREALRLYAEISDEQGRAHVLLELSDACVRSGRLNEAERLLREAMAAYESLGDERARAMTMGRIAHILEMRGELDEALRIRKEEVLPVFTKRGDARSRAVAMGRIADILEVRGELDEALRIRKEEVLPVFAKLGAMRDHARTMGAIAGILEAQGELDEALRIREQEEIPVYVKLGATKDLVLGRTHLARLLLTRGQPSDREAARDLLALARQTADALRLPEVDQIRRLQEQHGFLPSP